MVRKANSELWICPCGKFFKYQLQLSEHTGSRGYCLAHEWNLRKIKEMGK